MFVVNTPGETLITPDEPKAVEVTNEEIQQGAPVSVEMTNPQATQAQWVVPPNQPSPPRPPYVFRKQPRHRGDPEEEEDDYGYGQYSNFGPDSGYGPEDPPFQPQGSVRIPGRGMGPPSIPVVAGVNVIREVERLLTSASILKGMRMPDISIRRMNVMGRSATLGQARFRDPRRFNYMIRFTDFPTADRFDVFEVLAHEVAHLRAGPNARHNDKWKRTFELVGKQGYRVSHFTPYSTHEGHRADSLSAVLRGKPKRWSQANEPQQHFHCSTCDATCNL